MQAKNSFFFLGRGHPTPCPRQAFWIRFRESQHSSQKSAYTVILACTNLLLASIGQIPLRPVYLFPRNLNLNLNDVDLRAPKS